MLQGAIPTKCRLLIKCLHEWDNIITILHHDVSNQERWHFLIGSIMDCDLMIHSWVQNDDLMKRQPDFAQ